jgi:hypothetical protein
VDASLQGVRECHKEIREYCGEVFGEEEEVFEEESHFRKVVGMYALCPASRRDVSLYKEPHHRKLRGLWDFPDTGV